MLLLVLRGGPPFPSSRPLYCPDHVEHQQHERKKNHAVCNGLQGLFHLTMYLMKEKEGKMYPLPLIITVAKYIPK